MATQAGVEVEQPDEDGVGDDEGRGESIIDAGKGEVPEGEGVGLGAAGIDGVGTRRRLRELEGAHIILPGGEARAGWRISPVEAVVVKMMRRVKEGASSARCHILPFSFHKARIMVTVAGKDEFQFVTHGFALVVDFGGRETLEVGEILELLAGLVWPRVEPARPVDAQDEL